MSVSLVKKSLYLLESTSSDLKGKQNQKLNPNRPDVRRITPKSKVNKKNLNPSFLNSFKKLQKQLKEHKNKDKTELNLEKLRSLNDNIQIEDTRAVEFFKRASKNKEIKVVEKEEEQTTVFTEEDFARFEREYDFDE